MNKERRQEGGRLLWLRSLYVLLGISTHGSLSLPVCFSWDLRLRQDAGHEQGEIVRRKSFLHVPLSTPRGE